MTRQEKYPETSTFHYHNENPHNRITGDCTYRAIAYATKIPYNKVVMDFAKVQCESGYCGDKQVDAVLKEYGWVKCKQLRKSDNTKYTVRDFVKAFPKGTYIINLANHMTVIENGKNIDIWDCVKYGRTVGNYYVKAK